MALDPGHELLIGDANDLPAGARLLRLACCSALLLLSAAAGLTVMRDSL